MAIGPDFRRLFGSHQHCIAAAFADVDADARQIGDCAPAAMAAEQPGAFDLLIGADVLP
jgi:hypothetical protein